MRKKEQLSAAEIEMFYEAFTKENQSDAKIDTVDMPLLIQKIKESKFLRTNKATDLDWCLEHYEQIIANRYQTY